VDAGAVRLETRNLTVRFGGLTAVDNASFAVADGDVVGLIGPNGAGKTTLLNAISGFVGPAAGRVVVGGRDITGLAAHRRARLGIVRTFQHGGLVDGATVLQNCVMAQQAAMRTGPVAAALGRGVGEAKALQARGEAVLARLGLEAIAADLAGTLSHGRRKQVELATAFVRRPRLLLLDEPSAGLDPGETDALADSLGDLRQEAGCTTVLIDHDLRLVRRLARRVVVLSFGQLISDGDWEDVAADPAVVAAYLGPTASPAETHAAPRSR
jgi:ABC-type branched-subunit amino acid transport system ATPase component